MKKCRKCKEDRPEEDFWFNERKGRSVARCNACRTKDRLAYRLANLDKIKVANRDWQRRNPEKTKAAQERWKAKNPDIARERAVAWYKANKPRARAQQRERSQQLKDAVYNAYGGYVCNCCGETEPSFLSVDHVNNDGNRHRRATGFGTRRWSGKKIYSLIIDDGFPPDYQILCMNCNWGKARNGGVCPHKASEGSTTIPKGSRAKRPEARTPS